MDRGNGCGNGRDSDSDSGSDFTGTAAAATPAASAAAHGAGRTTNSARRMEQGDRRQVTETNRNWGRDINLFLGW